MPNDDNGTPYLTARTQEVLRELLNRPLVERSAGEIGQPINLPAPTVASLLARLIGLGWVADRREGAKRLYRLVPERLDEARDALGEPRPSSRPAAARARRDDDDRVWTVAELEAAVARGEETQEFLDLVRAHLAAARKKPKK